MLKQITSLLLVAMLFNLALVKIGYAAAASPESEKTARFAAKVKTNVLKLGIGESSRIKVKLRDKTKIEGYISSADDETFTVTDLKTGAASTISYSQVKSAKGKNLSTGAKIAIGVGIAAAVIIFIIYYVTVVYYDD